MAQHPVDVEEFIDERPFSAFQWIILTFCFLVVATDGLNTGIIGFITPSLMKEWGVSKAALGPVASAALFGLAIGALCAGPIADRTGRRLVIVASVLLFGCACLASAMANSLGAMISLRFVTGLGLGAALPNAVTLMSEYSPRRKRLYFGTLVMCGFTLGSAMAGFVSSRLVVSHGWRSVLVFSGALPIIVVPLLALFLPESVRFLVHKRAQDSRVEAILTRISPDPRLKGASFKLAQATAQTDTHSIARLFSQGNGIGTVLLWLIYFLSLFIVYLLTSWLPLMMQDAGIGIADAAAVTGMFMFGSTFGTVLIGWLMDQIKKYVVLASFYGIAMIAIALIGLHASDISFLRWIVFIAGVGMGSVTSMPAFAADFYDLQCRATGVSWMLGVGRFGGILGAGIGGVLISIGLSFRDIFLGLSVPAMLAAMIVGAMGLHYARRPLRKSDLLEVA